MARARWRAAAPVLIALVAFGLRVWAPGPVTETVDEGVWLRRSEGFHTAVAHHDFDRATAASSGELATMPGVTTMWAGTLGREIARIGDWVGLVDPVTTSYDYSPSVLRAGRAVVAAWSSIALWAIIVMAARLFSRRAALVTGVVLATEPWLVGHSDVLHTDAMVTMFGMASTLAILLAGARSIGWWRQPDADTGRPDVTRQRADEPAGPWVVRGWAALAGLIGALALLTKVNAVVLVVGSVGLVTVLLGVHRWRRPGAVSWSAWAVGWLQALAAWAAALLVTTIALWPALWTAPMTQLSLLRKSLSQAGSASPTLFQGKTSHDVSRLYYPVVLILRLSPWLLFGALFATIGLVGARLLRGRAGRGPQGPQAPCWMVLTCAAVPVVYLAAITVSGRKYDRYALPIVPFLALVLGVGVAAAAATVVRWWPAARPWLPPAGWVAAALMAAHALALAPYAISYVDPVVGGQRRAERTILLGWGEGSERLGQTIVQREGSHCHETVVSYPQSLHVAFPCVRLRGEGLIDGDVLAFDYVALYISRQQRHTSDRLEAATRRRGELIEQVKIGGVVYAELWKIRH